jgi:hypothetical protein
MGGGASSEEANALGAEASSSLTGALGAAGAHGGDTEGESFFTASETKALQRCFADLAGNDHMASVDEVAALPQLALNPFVRMLLSYLVMRRLRSPSAARAGGTGGAGDGSGGGGGRGGGGGSDEAHLPELYTETFEAGPMGLRLDAATWGAGFAKCCPKGHTLAMHTTEDGLGTCDGCNRKLESGTTVMDCTECDYFLCDQCDPRGGDGGGAGGGGGGEGKSQSPNGNGDGGGGLDTPGTMVIGMTAGSQAAEVRACTPHGL